MDKGRIPENAIEDLLARTDIVDVVSSRVKLKKSGQNHTGLCPFHNEKSPSFSVSQSKQFFHCFGCGAGGDAIKFLMDFDHMEFVQAVEELARLAGVELEREQQSGFSQEKSQQLKQLYQVLQTASDYFYDNLKNHTDRNIAVNYLKQRGLTGHTAKAFQIGYAPSGWQNLVTELKRQNISEQLLADAGLTVTNDQGKTYDRFRQRIMFPIRDARGRCIAFGGRVLNKDDKPKYLNSPETAAFHKGKELYGLYEAKMANRQLDKAIIVEGYMDVVALAQQGIHYAMATLGTATSSVHLQRLFKLVNEVTFCFDGDAAGERAARKAMELALPFLEDGRHIRILYLPAGEDPDTMVQKEGKDAFEDRVRSARPLLELLFEEERKDINFDSLEGRAAYAKNTLVWLKQIPQNSLVCKLAYSRLSQMTGLGEAELRQLDQQTAAKPAEKPAEAEQAANTSSDRNAVDAAGYNIETRVDIPRPKSRHSHSKITLAQRLTANLICAPALCEQLDIPKALTELGEPDIALLLEIRNLLVRSDRPSSNTHLICNWLIEMGYKDALAPILNSDYFWMHQRPEFQHNNDWQRRQFMDNLAQLNKKAPDIEYQHLKNRMNNHTSDVTEGEKQRFFEILRARKSLKHNLQDD